MSKIDITELYKKQISLTEWFEGAKHLKTEGLRIEDNEKRERLKVLSEIISLPFDKPHQFKSTDIIEQTIEFKKFLKDHQNELCALRLIPLDPKLPKLRMRGHTIKDALIWFKEQDIDPKNYKADFIPHSESQLWATTFVINKHGIFGEITRGGHYQVTQGFYDKGEPINFAFDFKKWSFSKVNSEAKKQIQEIVKKLEVKDHKDQKDLVKNLDAKFINNYLCGYFEALTTEEFGLWFVDYNRIIGKMYEDFTISKTITNSDKNIVQGFVGCQGKVQGRVHIILPDNLSNEILEEDEILICNMTTPEYLPLMQKALAIVTNLGGILSHAAIISRELNKPCITNTKNATEFFKNGDLIEVDAFEGTIKNVS